MDDAADVMSDYGQGRSDFNKVKIGDSLNLEYDILGKYINQNLLNRG